MHLFNEIFKLGNWGVTVGNFRLFTIHMFVVVDLCGVMKSERCVLTR